MNHAPEAIIRVLSVDPALRNTGYAVLERREGTRQPVHTAVTYGVIRNHRDLPQSACLVAIRRQLAEVIAVHQPEICAVESVIYVQSFKTAITLGAARGAALIAASEAGLPIHEYPPKRVKQAVVGKGAASKEQVSFMMRALLGLSETPSPDAADALAVGMTHLYTAGNRALFGEGQREI